jgi:predicted component of type VI protein secretion system
VATGGADAAVTWVAELWVDPDWYAQQDADEPCPSPGLPQTVLLTARSLLIGRKSVSRNIHPQIDVASDIGVSRRHAQLTTDGQRWWVEDLQSSNGTFVGGSRDPLPTQAVPPGQRRELDEDDRIYLGAWTRIVIRKTLPGEIF